MANDECTLLPPNPDFQTRGEQRVWQSLRRSLGTDDVLIHGLHFGGADGYAEADLVVLIPDVGFATIEVKDGSVWREEGAWFQRTPEGPKVIHPERQAIRTMSMLGKYLADRWMWGRPKMAHFVALPDTEWDEEDPSPGLPRERLIAAGDIDDAAAIVREALAKPFIGQPDLVPGLEHVQTAVALLGGRGEPQAQITRQASAVEDHVSPVEEQVRRLTEEQYYILQVAGQMPRVLVTGGPGSGKTWLAVEEARLRLQAGDSVAFVCYSRGLSRWVRRLTGAWPELLQQRLWVGTFHALGRQWGVTIPDSVGRDDPFWDRDFPGLMMEAAPSGRPQFDTIVVDEAQDFDDSWWPALLAGRVNLNHGRLAVFSDERQRVFDRQSDPLPGLQPLTLTRNLRNCREVARVFRPLAAERQELYGVEGGTVAFQKCRPSDAVRTADDAAVALLDSGWRPQDIALLTTHHRHPVHRDTVERHGQDEYWARLWDEDDIFYSTVMAFKGLERPAVVLAVDGFRNPDTARQTLYAGLSRARDHLVVCGDPEELRRVGGKELVKNLERQQ